MIEKKTHNYPEQVKNLVSLEQAEQITSISETLSEIVTAIKKEFTESNKHIGKKISASELLNDIQMAVNQIAVLDKKSLALANYITNLDDLYKEHLLQIEYETIHFIKSFAHDLRNIVAVLGMYPYLVADYTKETTTQALLKDKKNIQELIVRLLQFLQSYDFEKMVYRFSPTHLNFIVANLENTLGGFTKGTQYQQQYDHHTNELGLFTNKSLVDYTSLMTTSFLNRFLFNINQNVERLAMVNGKGEQKPLTSVNYTLRYELRDAVLLEKQVVSQGKGIWVILDYQDDGPGFSESMLDEAGNFSPVYGVSTHAGEGIALVSMQEDVIEAGGTFKMRNQDGAHIEVAFPLLHASTK